jgi:nicotinamide riboside kinase
MKTKVINFVASPSSGKSTMASYLFAILKTKHYKAEYIQEHAKWLIYQEKFEELNNQYNVSTEQYKLIKSVDKKVNYIILDSPLVLGLYYNRHFETNVSNVEKTENMILDKIQEFDNVYIFLTKNKKYPFENEGRVHTEEQSITIERELRELLIKLNLPFLEIVSDINNIQDILDYIL